MQEWRARPKRNKDPTTAFGQFLANAQPGVFGARWTQSSREPEPQAGPSGQPQAGPSNQPQPQADYYQAGPSNANMFDQTPGYRLPLPAFVPPAGHGAGHGAGQRGSFRGSRRHAPPAPPPPAQAAYHPGQGRAYPAPIESPSPATPASSTRGPLPRVPGRAEEVAYFKTAPRRQ